MSQKSAAEKAGSVIRDTDLMGSDDQSNLFLVLSNANESEAEFVKSRLDKLGLSAELVEEMEKDE